MGFAGEGAQESMTEQDKAVLVLLGYSSMTNEARFMVSPFVGQPHYETAQASLDMATHALGYASFAEYWQIRHRQWLLTQIDSAMDAGRQKQQDEKMGQRSLFD